MDRVFQNILVVRTDRIGDVVLTTPALRALRRAFPKARITLLTAPLTKGLVDGNPDIDEVLVDDRTDKHRGAMGFWNLVGAMRRKHFDLAIVFYTKRRTNALCALAGIPERLGYRNNKFGFLLTHPVRDDRSLGKKHEAEYCLHLLTEIGVAPAGLETTVQVRKEARRWAEHVFHERGWDKTGVKVAALHPGASDPSKQWPSARFAELTGVLWQRFSCDVCLIGSPACAAPATEIMRLAGGVPVADLTGRTSLEQTVALLERCAILVSNDSGPVHLAAAVGTPVVSLFTRNQPGINPERWRPLGPKSRVVAARLEEGRTFEGGRICDPADLDRIRPAEVVEAVDALFKLC